MSDLQEKPNYHHQWFGTSRTESVVLLDSCLPGPLSTRFKLSQQTADTPGSRVPNPGCVRVLDVSVSRSGLG